MSKITFRADEDLVERLEAFDASKSEVMREALRAYLDDAAEADVSDASDGGSVDDVLAERVDELIAERLDAHLGARPTVTDTRDINVNVTVDGATADADETSVQQESVPTDEAEGRKTDGANVGDGGSGRRKTCGQCGDEMTAEHVYCPNCGEKATHRVFCDCGDELRSDWAFCPSCGRRTPAADVLDTS
jgi:predicted transcriptional regulator